MIIYYITKTYNNELFIGEIQVKECKLTYSVTKSCDNYYSGRIHKNEVNKFNERTFEVFCFDKEEGFKIFKEGIINRIKTMENKLNKEKEKAEKLINKKV